MLSMVIPLVGPAMAVSRAGPAPAHSAVPLLIAVVLGVVAYLLQRVRRMVGNPAHWPALITIMTLGPTILVIGAVLVLVEAMIRT